MLTTFERRKLRTRGNIAARNKSLRPRIVVYRSNKNLSIQLVNVEGFVVKAYSTVNFEEKKKISGIEKAKLVGSEISKIAKNHKVSEIVFDRNKYAYHGQVKALAEGAREAGLKF